MPAAVAHGNQVGEHRLAVLDEIEKHRLVAAAQCEDVQRLAAVVNSRVGPHEEVVAGRSTSQHHLAAADLSLVVAGADRPGNLVGLGRQFHAGHAQVVARKLVRDAADADPRLGRPAVRIACEQIDDVGNIP